MEKILKKELLRIAVITELWNYSYRITLFWVQNIVVLEKYSHYCKYTLGFRKILECSLKLQIFMVKVVYIDILLCKYFMSLCIGA